MALWASATPCNLSRLPGEEFFSFAKGTSGGGGGGGGIAVPNCINTKLWLKGDKAIEPAEVDLSLVVPAYKETERLPTMMKETLSYLEGEWKSPQFSPTRWGVAAPEDTRRGALKTASCPILVFLG